MSDVRLQQFCIPTHFSFSDLSLTSTLTRFILLFSSLNQGEVPQERRNPGRRSRRGSEPTDPLDEAMPAPTARRIGHVHATITLNPADRM